MWPVDSRSYEVVTWRCSRASCQKQLRVHLLASAHVVTCSCGEHYVVFAGGAETFDAPTHVRLLTAAEWTAYQRAAGGEDAWTYWQAQAATRAAAHARNARSA